MKKLFLGLGVVALAILSCTNQQKVTPIASERSTPKDKTVLTDSLIYSIATFQSANVDSLENEAFKRFLQDKLVNYIFDQLYGGKLKAYEFLSDKELSITDIQKIEKSEGFTRMRVGKVQFNEQWYVDKNGALYKKVNSAIFGVEHYSNQGNFINYNALFRVKF